jgi:hypothetical protein
MKYAIEADDLSHAMDELVMTEHSREFEEVTQRWLGEQIMDAEEVSQERLTELVQQWSQDKNEMCSHWMGDKLIHKVNYETTSSE